MEEKPKQWAGEPLGYDARWDQWPPLDDAQLYWPPKIPPVPAFERAGEDGSEFRATFRRGKPPIIHTDIRSQVAGVAVARPPKKHLANMVKGSLLMPAALFAANMALNPSEQQAPETESSASASDGSTELDSAALLASLERLQAGGQRTTVVIDLGHGPYKTRNADGKLVTENDPGAIKSVAGGDDIYESNVTAALGARVALQLIQRGIQVEFTRSVDSQHNPHLKDLNETEHRVLAQIDNDRLAFDEKQRFNQRIETARDAHARDPKAIYLVLHADTAPNKERRGGAVYIHPDTPTTSSSYRLAETLEQGLTHDSKGPLIINRTKGVVPKQDGHGALYNDDCTPRKGLGLREVGIISPHPVRSIKNGLGDMTTVLLEAGFLNNDADVWRLTNRTWATNYARVIGEAIDRFVGREYEGVKPPAAPATIAVNGKQAYVVPNDPLAAAQLTRRMAADIPADKGLTTGIQTRVVQRCRPSGAKYDVRIAEYMPIKPKLEAKPEKAPSTIPEQPRKPSDFAKRDDGPRTRS